MLKYLKRIKEKKGSGAIISMLLIAGLLPLLLFTFIDVPYYNQYHRRMKNIVDNTAASAVTRLNEELFPLLPECAMDPWKVGGIRSPRRMPSFLGGLPFRRTRKQDVPRRAGS